MDGNAVSALCSTAAQIDSEMESDEVKAPWRHSFIKHKTCLPSLLSGLCGKSSSREGTAVIRGRGRNYSSVFTALQAPQIGTLIRQDGQWIITRSDQNRSAQSQGRGKPSVTQRKGCFDIEAGTECCRFHIKVTNYRRSFLFLGDLLVMSF